MPIITVKNLIKNYSNGEVLTRVLRGVDLEIQEGEFVAIMGKSGAGKSTLLYQMGLLDTPTEGDLVIDGIDVLSLSEKQRTNFRLTRLGYVFQDYALVPELTALENVAIPLLMEGFSQFEVEEKSRQALTDLGLSEKCNNQPNQLSGGEQQRVSIARAIVQNPKILFADEPTANLDSVSSEAVLEALTKLHKQGQTIVMVTHEEEYTRNCDKVIYLVDGAIAQTKIL